MRSIAQAIADATATLAAAGVASPLNDARLLAAHLIGCQPMELALRGAQPMPEEFAQLVSRRAAREPLQHILGTAPLGHLDLLVGPGVFIPRPETELLGDWAVTQLRAMTGKTLRVLDLCTGSGALALYIASLVPHAQVTAVELDPQARKWAARNITALELPVDLIAGDATDPELLPGNEQAFDLIVSNPPYVPESTEVEPEVQVDPHHAVFSGESGMDVIQAMVPVITRLLRPGGKVGIEHDDATAAAVMAELEKPGIFSAITSHQDFAGRDRFVTATKTTE